MNDEDKAIEEIVLERLKEPKFSGHLAHPTHSLTFQNPLCNDHVTYDLKIVDNIVSEARFTATGCVLSRAAGDMISEMITQRSLNQIIRIDPALILTSLGDVVSVRKKCATFGLEEIQNWIKNLPGEPIK